MNKWVTALLACMMVSVTGCASLCGKPAVSEVKLWHVVIVRLNQPGDVEARRKLVEATKGFRRIKGVQVAYVGTVLPGSRPHVDSGFDVGVVMGFRTQEDMEGYVKDPIHQRAVEEVLKPLAKDYVVYDFENE